MPADASALAPSQHGVRCHFRSIVRDNHVRLAAPADQLIQFTGHRRIAVACIPRSLEACVVPTPRFVINSTASCLNSRLNALLVMQILQFPEHLISVSKKPAAGYNSGSVMLVVPKRSTFESPLFGNSNLFMATAAKVGFSRRELTSTGCS